MYQRGISDQIERFRKSRGLDRHEFAEAIGKDYLTVAKWENGRTVPTDEELYTISFRFNTPAMQFGLPEREAPTEAPAPKAEAPAPKAEKPAPKAEAPAPKVEKPTFAAEQEKSEGPKVEIICSERLTEPAAEEKPEPVALEAVEEAPIADEEEKAIPETCAPEAEADERTVAVTPKEIKAYEEKKERYEKHVRLSSYTRASVKIRRMFAYTIDVIISVLFSFALAVAAGIVIAGFLKSKLTLIATAYAIGAAFAVCFVAVFVFRDWIFGGRSLGKRMFCLKVVDEKTGKKAFVWQRLWRTVLTVDALDIFLLIFTGRTVGDRITGARVVSSRHYRKPVIPELDEAGEPIYDIPERPRKNHTFLTLLVVLLTVAAILLSGFVVYKGYMYLTDAEKDTEEYSYAVNYLVENAEKEIAEEDVDLIGFSLHFDVNDSLYVTYLFYVEGDLYSVCISQIDNGVWAICEDCTYIK